MAHHSWRQAVGDAQHSLECPNAPCYLVTTRPHHRTTATPFGITHAKQTKVHPTERSTVVAAAAGVCVLLLVGYATASAPPHTQT